MDVKADQHLHARITEINQRLRKLDTRLGRVTTNICGGPVPETQGETPKPIDEHLHDKLDSTHRLLASLEDEMTRMENSVGSNQAAPTSQAGYAVGR
jgi:hypothetical protein